MTEQTNNQEIPHSEAQPEQPQEQSLLTSQDEIVQVKERLAFEKYVETNGEGIPENFKDAGAWFDSLKESQKQYTQSRQEVADLKATYAENGSQNPNYKEQVETTPEAAPEPETPITDELRIPNETPKIEEETASVKGVPEEEYMKWGTELATTGKLSSETRESIKSLTGFTDGMINDYEAAQHARLKNRFDEASQVVGGRENMDKMFKWATTNLSQAERDAINTGLSSSQYEITLRGLASKYNESVDTSKAKEPTTTPQNIANVPDSESGYIGYRTNREFKADRDDPKFLLEPKFRQAVEERMARTDWNTLPA